MYGHHASISPDGLWIVYSTCEYQTEGLEAPYGYGNWGGQEKYNYEIATVSIDGTSPERLTENEHLDHYPVWSPDGTRIAFVASSVQVYVYDEGHLFTMSPDGSNISEVIVMPSGTGVALYPPVWSPDGQRLAFIVHEGEWRSRKSVLYTVRPDGSDLNKIGETAALPTWSPDSEELAFARAEGERAAIYTVNADGTGLWQTWVSGPDKDHPPISQVSWSPDGSELLVVSGWAWVVQPDGSGQRRLGPQNPAVWLDRAAWSFDGSRIAAHGSEFSTKAGHFKVITMARDGTDLRVLVISDEDGGLKAAR